MHRPLIILDRDGVINEESSAFVKSADEWIALPGSLDAIARFFAAGWQITIATNQSGLARGKFSYHDLVAMHGKMLRLLAQRGARVDGVFFCPHGPDDGCDCRKPRTGLYRQIARYLGCSVEGAVSVGDSARDLEAAAAAGARPILVRTGNGRHTETSLGNDNAIPVYDDLAAVADALLE